MTRRAFVHRVSARSPDDMSGLSGAFESGLIDPGSVVAVLGKTEGNGCVNDWTRALAARAFKDLLARHVGPDGAKRVSTVMSGGTEGGIAPHFTLIEVRDSVDAARSRALAVGVAHTAALPAEHIGRLAQVDGVAAGVRAALADAGIDTAEAVHLVQVKCPLLTRERIGEAEARGVGTATRDTLKSMALSRAASALGVAVALGDVDRGRLTEGAIASDWSIYSGRASVSAGGELLGHEIVLFGDGVRGWAGPLRIDHAVMADAIDVEPVRGALRRLGLAAEGQLGVAERARVVAVIAKAEASSDGLLRGFRHTMLNDSDIAPTRHARAFAAGALAGLLGHGELYVSGGAEHQGPDGGGPVAVIVDAAAAWS